MTLEQVLCAVAIVLAVAATAWIVFLTRGAQQSMLFPGGWKSVLAAWREARTPPEHALVVLMVLCKGRAYCAVAIGAIAVMAGVVAAGCGVDWLALIRELRKILRDILIVVRGGELPQLEPAAP